MKSRYIVALAASAALAVGGIAAASAAPAVHGSAAPAAACTSIKTTLGQSQGSAGSMFQTFRFTNTGSSACTLAGYPHVAYVNIHHIMVGWPAKPEASLGGDAVPPAVVVAPGQTVRAVQQIPDYENFPFVDCLPFNGRSLRVIVAGHTTFLPWNQTECTTMHARTLIGPITG